MRVFREDSVRENEQDMKEYSEALPLSFVLEGKSWRLTTVVQATMALWMISMAFEGGGMLHRFSLPAGSFGVELLQYLVYIFVGTLAAAIGVCALTPNLRRTNYGNWRWQSIQSTFALVVMDTLAVYHTREVLRSMISTATSGTSNAERISLAARGFLWMSGMCFILIFNYLFVSKFGCCTFCGNQKYGFKKFLEKSSTLDSILSWAKSQEVTQRDLPSRECSEEESLSDGPRAVEQDSSLLPTDPHATVSIPDEQCTTRDESGTTSQNALDSTLTHGRRPKGNSVRFCEIEEDPLMSVNTQCSSQDVDQNIEEDLLVQDHCAPAEVEDKPTLKPDLSMSMHKRLLVGDEKIMSLFSLSRHPLRKLWDEVKEEKGCFRYPVWVKSTFLTSIVMLIYACIKTIGFIVSLLEQYEEQRDRIAANMEKLDEFLIETGWMNGVDGIAKSTTIRLCLVLDKVIRSLEWTAFVGYPIGTLFGICSVIAIMVQYKRVSLKLSTETKENNGQREAGEQDSSRWMEFQDQYPVINAYVFMAIVSSTAVLQAQIASTILCLVLGLLWHCLELWSMAIYFGPFLLTSIAIFAFDFFAMKFLKQHLLHEDGREIKHPRRFDLFMMVLSTVHLLVGMLYAVWRVVYLMITTLFVLNRLDVSLFTSWKSLDNGHNAFMSMLTLNLLIQRDTECCVGKPEVELQTFLKRDRNG